jgi:hypothetical protein
LVAPINSHSHLLGGLEAGKGLELRQRLARRLDPEDPAKLADEVKRFVGTFGTQIAKHRAELQRREAEVEAMAAEVKARRDARAKEVAARIEEQDRLRRAAAKAAVDEVML